MWGEPGDWVILALCFAVIAAGCAIAAPLSAFLDRSHNRKGNP